MAAGAVVIEDVPPGVIVAGVPAKVIRTVDEALSQFKDIEKVKDEMEKISMRVK